MKYLGDSPENLFQRIKRYIREYEAEHGVGSSINVAVGEPDTVPPKTFRKMTAEAVLSDENAIHTYWDNRDPGKFCRNIVLQITGINIDDYPHIHSLVLPGEKAMLGLLPISCGANSSETFENEGFVRTAPAYDLVGVWAEYLGVETDVWPLFSEENFALNLKNLPKNKKPPRMIITVKPGNPCPAGAQRKNWEELIKYCIANNVRLVNDAAYTSLVHGEHVPLSAVAKDYPELEWIEMFSISKTLSACGWRLGAAIGSADFIDELTKVKGNADSGPFGPALVAAEKYFASEVCAGEISEVQKMYDRRLHIAIPIFEAAGFKLACPTDAGFFMLFHCPKKLNGEEITSSEDFNKKMISTIGLVGVPFSGAKVDGNQEQFIRYSVCSDFENEAFANRVQAALRTVKVEY